MGTSRRYLSSCLEASTKASCNTSDASTRPATRRSQSHIDHTPQTLAVFGEQLGQGRVPLSAQSINRLVDGAFRAFGHTAHSNTGVNPLTTSAPNGRSGS